MFASPFTTSILFASSGLEVHLDILSLLIELLTIIALPMVLGYVISSCLLICSWLNYWSLLSHALRKSIRLLLKFFHRCFYVWYRGWKWVLPVINWRLCHWSISFTPFFWTLSFIIFSSHSFTFYVSLHTHPFLLRNHSFFLVPWKHSLLLWPVSLHPFFYLVISFLPEELGSHGIILVPALLFHFTQVWLIHKSNRIASQYIIYDRFMDSQR